MVKVLLVHFASQRQKHFPINAQEIEKVVRLGASQISRGFHCGLTALEQLVSGQQQRRPRHPAVRIL
jgi:hypothetical protein